MEDLVPTGFRSQNRAARSESYRLRFPGPQNRYIVPANEPVVTVFIPNSGDFENESRSSVRRLYFSEGIGMIARLWCRSLMFSRRA